MEVFEDFLLTESDIKALFKSTQTAIVKCVICLNNAKDPKIMVCKHMFCSDCLKQYTNMFEENRGNSLQCPCCKTKINKRSCYDYPEIASSPFHELISYLDDINDKHTNSVKTSNMNSTPSKSDNYISKSDKIKTPVLKLIDQKKTPTIKKSLTPIPTVKTSENKSNSSVVKTFSKTSPIRKSKEMPQVAIEKIIESKSNKSVSSFSSDPAYPSVRAFLRDHKKDKEHSNLKTYSRFNRKVDQSSFRDSFDFETPPAQDWKKKVHSWLQNTNNDFEEKFMQCRSQSQSEKEKLGKENKSLNRKGLKSKSFSEFEKNKKVPSKNLSTSQLIMERTHSMALRNKKIPNKRTRYSDPVAFATRDNIQELIDHNSLDKIARTIEEVRLKKLLTEFNAVEKTDDVVPCTTQQNTLKRNNSDWSKFSKTELKNTKRKFKKLDVSIGSVKKMINENEDHKKTSHLTHERNETIVIDLIDSNDCKKLPLTGKNIDKKLLSQVSVQIKKIPTPELNKMLPNTSSEDLLHVSCPNCCHKFTVNKNAENTESESVLDKTLINASSNKRSAEVSERSKGFQEVNDEVLSPTQKINKDSKNTQMTIDLENLPPTQTLSSSLQKNVVKNITRLPLVSSSNKIYSFKKKKSSECVQTNTENEISFGNEIIPNTEDICDVNPKYLFVKPKDRERKRSREIFESDESEVKQDLKLKKSRLTCSDENDSLSDMELVDLCTEPLFEEEPFVTVQEKSEGHSENTEVIECTPQKHLRKRAINVSLKHSNETTTNKQKSNEIKEWNDVLNINPPTSPESVLSMLTTVLPPPTEFKDSEEKHLVDTIVDSSTISSTCKRVMKNVYILQNDALKDIKTPSPTIDVTKLKKGKIVNSMATPEIEFFENPSIMENVDVFDEDTVKENQPLFVNVQFNLKKITEVPENRNVNTNNSDKSSRRTSGNSGSSKRSLVFDGIDNNCSVPKTNNQIKELNEDICINLLNSSNNTRKSLNTQTTNFNSKGSSLKSIMNRSLMSNNSQNNNDEDKTIQNRFGALNVIKSKSNSIIVHSGASSSRQMSIVNFVERNTNISASQNKPADINEFDSSMYDSFVLPHSYNTENILKNAGSQVLRRFETPYSQKFQKPMAFSTPLHSQMDNDKNEMCVGSSRLTEEQTAILKDFCLQHHLRYLSNISLNVTHLIMVTNERNEITDPTAKYILAVAGGKWVLNFNWILECIQEERLVPEEDYEVLDTSGVPSPKLSRLSNNTIFSQFDVFTVEPLISCPKNIIQLILKTAGARVFNSLEDMLAVGENRIRVIVTEMLKVDDGSIFQEWYDKHHIATVDSEWVTQSISQNKIQSLMSWLACQIDTQIEVYPAALMVETQDEDCVSDKSSL